MNNSDGLVRWQIKYNNRGLYFCNHLCLKAAERNEVTFGGSSNGVLWAKGGAGFNHATYPPGNAYFDQMR